MDNIVLPAFLIADLYAGCLVDIKETDPVATLVLHKRKETAVDVDEEPDSHLLKYLGQNKRNVVVIVKEPDMPFINDDDLQFLVKILNACSLNMSDIAILNLHTQPFLFNTLSEQLQPKYIIMFDVDTTAIKIPFIIPHFQLQKYADCTILTAPSLKNMIDDTPASKLLKSRLWITLQKAFNLS